MSGKTASDFETPPSTAPEEWAGIDAETWQSQKGRWAAPQHYMCTYMAMFPPELPHYFIQRFTLPGDTVLDPFSGRGTTPVAASACGRKGIGNDLNPLAVALTRGKLSNPPMDSVLSRIDELEAAYDKSEWSTEAEPEKIRLIYHENTLRQLVYLKASLDWDYPGVDSFIVAVLMGAMHGSSKGFLSLPMPNTFSMGWGYITRKVQEEPEKFACPDRDAFLVLRGRVRRQLAKGLLSGSGYSIYGDVRDLSSKIEHGSIQLLFTSPPYLKVIKYGLYNWIRLWFLTDSGSHEEVDEVLDDTHALEEYLEFIRMSLEATLPLLDPQRGLSCWAIGDVKNFNLAWAVWHHIGQHIALENEDGSLMRYQLIAIINDEIPDNQKVTKMWKTLIHHVERIDEEGTVIETLISTTDKQAAKECLKQAQNVVGTEVKIRTEKTNDKSGKATPKDRILIIAPESAIPTSIKDDEKIDWRPISDPIRNPEISSFA